MRYGWPRILPAALAFACLAMAPATEAQLANPFDGDPTAIDAGRVMYESRCSECHGADAKGLAGADLTQLWLSGVGDERVFAIARAGVPDTIMPPSTAPDQEIWAIVTYLKSVSTVPPFAAESGDPGRGREIFAAECASCHRAAGAGGSLGPDLTQIALVRSRGALVEAIREPSAVVASTFKPVTLVMSDGTRILGIRKGEDAFSIQILDTDERLQGYVKAKIAEIIYESSSLMPAIPAERLGDSGMEDLLAFLATLR